MGKFKKIGKSIVLIFLVISGLTKAQFTMHKLLHVGYVYQNQSFGEVGGTLLFLSNDDVIYRIGASAMLGSVNSEMAVMPKIQGDLLLNFQKNVDFYHAWYFSVGAESTTKYIAPKVGLTLFGIFDISAGYAVSLSKDGLHGKELHGFNLNTTLRIPIVVFSK